MKINKSFTVRKEMFSFINATKIITALENPTFTHSLQTLSLIIGQTFLTFLILKATVCVHSEIKHSFL